MGGIRKCKSQVRKFFTKRVKTVGLFLACHSVRDGAARGL